MHSKVSERLRNMACVRCYLCVMLILLSFAQSETRPLDPSVVRRNLIRTIRALGETELHNVKQGDEGMIRGQLSIDESVTLVGVGMKGRILPPQFIWR
ncbi:hypothetical protein SADUNF_Sadunf11G0040300 [Salix dunnii]|uniref:Uncharacterized protein n=1 Tax=Salix dunnii TaxID=1413687 RepID=A0A835MQ76_9ROSI|nr:hypothetical protein SADUNF_Sadunf11G0040300 [Salix dunnii]